MQAMFIFLARLGSLVLLAAPCLAYAGAGIAPAGSLVIIGGALRADNAPVWQRIVQLAGGQGARIAVFPSAAGQPEASGQSAIDHLRHYGADAFLVPIAPRMAGTDAQRNANDPALAAQVREAGGAFFTGGDQGRITGALRRPDGSNSLVLDALWQMYRRGGVIAGTSAGAAIMSSTMFYDAKPVLATLQLGVRDGREIAPGLGFIGDDIFIDQHLLIRGRFARMLPVMRQKGYRRGFGIDENSALVVLGKQVEAIGYRGVQLLELDEASGAASARRFTLHGARISYLDAGDRMNLASGEIMPSADKAGEPIAFPATSAGAPLFCADILANSAVLDLMQKLADSEQPRAIGLAFDAPGSARARDGFLFTLERDGRSRAYRSAASEAVSVYRLRLDIRPVDMQAALYRDPARP